MASQQDYWLLPWPLENLLEVEYKADSSPNWTPSEIASASACIGKELHVFLNHDLLIVGPPISVPARHAFSPQMAVSVLIRTHPSRTLLSSLLSLTDYFSRLASLSVENHVLWSPCTICMRFLMEWFHLRHTVSVLVSHLYLQICSSMYLGKNTSYEQLENQLSTKQGTVVII